MSSRAVHYLMCFFLFPEVGVWAQVANSSGPAQDLPSATGVYFRQEGTGWTKLEHAIMADTKSRGMGRFLETDGLSNLNTTMVYRGAQSAVRIADGKPAFYVRGVGTPDDAIIVRLVVKRDRREAQISSSLAGVHNLLGFKRGQIHRVVTASLSKDMFSVQPIEDLKAGEYLLVLGQTDSVFDFGVNQAKK